MTLVQMKGKYCNTAPKLVNYELERVGKENALPQFKALHWQMHKETEENHKSPPKNTTISVKFLGRGSVVTR
jgi:hypothetical protein